MKIKLAILFGILIWALTFIITETFNPIFTDNIPYVNLIFPITIIIVTGFFGILYIRNIDENEVVEGILVGIIFIIIDIICDYLFIIIPHTSSSIIDNYPLHIISITVITLLIKPF